MKFFIIRILIFAGLFLTYSGLNVLINNNFISNNPNNEQIHTLIVGDSHPMMSINPILLTKSKNICSSAETLFLTNKKLIYFTQKYNPKRIILGLSPHNLSEFNDKKYYENESAETMIKRSYPYTNLNEISKYFQISKIKYWKVLFRRFCLYPIFDHYELNYKNQRIIKSNTKNYRQKIQRHFFKGEVLQDISQVQKLHLLDIIKWCQKNKIELVIVNCPVSKEYFENIPKKFKTEYNNLVSTLKNNNIVLDHSKIFNETSLFVDSDHLNSLGRDKYTRILKSILE